MARNIVGDLQRYKSLEQIKAEFIDILSEYVPDASLGISFDVEDNGTISLVILGRIVAAKPRLVNMWDHGLVLEWKFVAAHGIRVAPIWSFYLFQDGNVYDESTGAFRDAPESRIGDHKNSYLGKMITMCVYENLLASEIFKP